MNILVAMLCYLVVAAGLFVGLVRATIWLVQPDPALSQSASPERPRPIPRRIADSIERKMMPVPKIPSIPEPKSEPVKPVMNEADASLAPAPASKLKVRDLQAPQQKKRTPKPRGPEQGVAYTVPVPPAPVVTTARSDNPY